MFHLVFNCSILHFNIEFYSAFILRNVHEKFACVTTTGGGENCGNNHFGICSDTDGHNSSELGISRVVASCSDIFCFLLSSCLKVVFNCGQIKKNVKNAEATKKKKEVE